MEDLNQHFSVESPIERDRRMNRIIGLVLLGVGFAIAVWIISNLMTVLTNPDKVQLINYIAKSTGDGIVVNEHSASTKITMPDNVLFLISVGIYILILSVAVGLVKAFITGGVKLLAKHDSQMLIELQKDVQEIKREILR